MDRRTFVLLSASLLTSSFLPGENKTGQQSKSDAASGKTEDDKRPIIAMVIYPEFTALDLVGPYQFLSALTDYRVVIVAEKVGPVVTDTGMSIYAEQSFEECPKNVAVVFLPGGTSGTIAAMKNASLKRFVAEKAKTAKYVTSVCTGSLILASIGILEGRRATCHWLVRDKLSRFGVKPVNQRVVEDGKCITGAGVSAGLDLGLVLIEKLAGKEYAKQCQLWFEYDPKPMFDSGSPEKARKQDVSMLQNMVTEFRVEIEKLAKSSKRK
jgi:cyclohexyl-isocyanide hydratase